LCLSHHLRYIDNVSTEGTNRPAAAAPALSHIYKQLQKYMADPGELYLVQSVETQTLFICRKEKVVDRYDASTSRFGVGIREGSFKTPPGIHRIKEKIGAGAPIGRIFKNREDTGVDWDGASTEENFILTRILRLEGLEEGINKGPGVDSDERCIYIHGTNREDLVGTPLSNGCIALRNLDILRLFDAVSEGMLVYIDPLPLRVGDCAARGVHFTGIFGTGMSALAQYLRFEGIAVSGSDRLLESADTAAMRSLLEGLGIRIAGQDGAGVGPDTDVVCVSTAVEPSNPDIAAAAGRGLPVIHRSDLLAALIASKRTIAVAGTSGKSTVTAMIFEFLTACGKSPSLISGAPLRRLERQGLIGNAWSGASDLLVVEADESDGTLVKYAPEAAAVLNVSKDHKTVEELKGLFATLISKAAWSATNADDPVLASLPATVRFGRSAAASWRPDREELLPASVTLFRQGIAYRLLFPGRHNLENLAAALCVCEHCGCEGAVLADAAAGFEGAARRFDATETKSKVRVIDDFAHNPAKISAAVLAARGGSARVIAVYQPHGFGPTRFLKDEYIATFRATFQTGDSLYLLPIYYAGGTAEKNISSDEIVAGLGATAFAAKAVKDRDELLACLKADARPGDCVIIMGARDPSLPALVRQAIALFGGPA
jgi:UDP-N-acetylmuramate--alanine ligase